MPVKQAEISSWRRVVRVFVGGDVAVGSRVVVDLCIGGCLWAEDGRCIA